MGSLRLSNFKPLFQLLHVFPEVGFSAGLFLVLTEITIVAFARKYSSFKVFIHFKTTFQFTKSKAWNVISSLKTYLSILKEYLVTVDLCMARTAHVVCCSSHSSPIDDFRASCDVTSRLVGSRFSECTGIGEWDAPLPECERKYSFTMYNCTYSRIFN